MPKTKEIRGVRKWVACGFCVLNIAGTSNKKRQVARVSAPANRGRGQWYTYHSMMRLAMRRGCTCHSTRARVGAVGDDSAPGPPAAAQPFRFCREETFKCSSNWLVHANISHRFTVFTYILLLPLKPLNLLLKPARGPIQVDSKRSRSNESR